MRGVEKFIVVLLLAVGIIIPACTQKDSRQHGEGKPATEQKAGMVKTQSGLSYIDVVQGSGPSPIPGKGVKVHYTGWLENGKKFDSSVDRGEPFIFQIGVGQVIPGWDEGVMTMKVGGKRKLVIPPQLGYGPQGAGSDIPPNATLHFDVELIDVER